MLSWFRWALSEEKRVYLAPSRLRATKNVLCSVIGSSQRCYTRRALYRTTPEPYISMTHRHRVIKMSDTNQVSGSYLCSVQYNMDVLYTYMIDDMQTQSSLVAIQPTRAAYKITYAIILFLLHFVLTNPVKNGLKTKLQLYIKITLTKYDLFQTGTDFLLLFQYCYIALPYSLHLYISTSHTCMAFLI